MKQHRTRPTKKPLSMGKTSKGPSRRLLAITCFHTYWHALQCLLSVMRSSSEKPRLGISQKSQCDVLRYGAQLQIIQIGTHAQVTAERQAHCGYAMRGGSAMHVQCLILESPTAFLHCLIKRAIVLLRTIICCCHGLCLPGPAISTHQT